MPAVQSKHQDPATLPCFGRITLLYNQRKSVLPGFGRPGIHKGTVQFGNATQVRERTRFGQEVNR